MIMKEQTYVTATYQDEKDQEKGMKKRNKTSPTSAKQIRRSNIIDSN